MKSFKVYLFYFLLISQSVFAVESGLKKQTHAGAADGLTRIDENGVYLYEVKNPLKNESSHIRMGSAENPQITIDITALNGATTTVTFDDIYEGASKLTVGYDYDYFFTTAGGKLGLQLGVAFQYATGQGRLVIDPSKKSSEKFSFLTMPLYLGGTYRFEYKDKQLIAPYVSGGGVYMLLAEKREDRSKVNAIGGLGFYGAGGILFNITAMDREMAADFRNEYDISNLWLNLEFKTVQINADVFDYSSSFIQGGLSFDF